MKSNRRTMRANRRARVKAYLADRLGSTCADCGSSESIQYAHRDREQKSFSLARAAHYPWPLIEAEAKKCRPLCKPCHIRETLVRRDWEPLPPDAKARRLGP